MTNSVTIIIPIYGAWPSLDECIESIKANVDTTKHAVMLVNDLGPEAEIIDKNVKAAIKGLPGFSYHRNPRNLGFLGNCNNAVLKLEKTDNDILLLNSDTRVTPGWLEELCGVLDADSKIGAVSPRSNNATICTLPLAAVRDHGIEAKKSYELFRTHHHKFPRYAEVPTAHGFCLLIRRSLIKQYGLFDPAFGKGYGEEVDFCQRLAQHGYKSVLSHWSYVFHTEARSFTSETKARLLEINNKIIRERYPDYQQSVRDYIDRAQAAEAKILGGSQRLKSMAKRLLKRR